MLVLTYLGSQRAKFQLGGCADLLRFLEMGFGDGSDEETASSFVQASEKCDGDPNND
jgi:hypothetical protein